MKKSNRYITSLLMTIIYMVIVFSPLAPLAMQAGHVAHAATGECSGDCTIDGCSLERSAAHTCCCWQKKKHGADDAHSDTCAIPSAPVAETPKKRADCCDTSAQEVPEKRDATKSAATSAPNKTKPVTVSSAPCGSGKLFAILSVETTQHLPFFFAGYIPSPKQSPLPLSTPDRLTSRFVDPPDPPPIII
jgi:hypothetical protein